jgi:hypothetical protein
MTTPRDELMEFATTNRLHPNIAGFITAFSERALTVSRVEWREVSALLEEGEQTDAVRDLLGGLVGDEFVEFCRVADALPSIKQIMAGANSPDPSIQYAIETLRNYRLTVN